MKKIAIFCDGTWNTPDERIEGKLCQTNVVKMANALSATSNDGMPQLLYYNSGIGTEGNLLSRVYDGATGTGISENILQAYVFSLQTTKGMMNCSFLDLAEALLQFAVWRG